MDQSKQNQGDREPAEGSRDGILREEGGGQTRRDEQTQQRHQGGISNRGLDRDLEEQEQLPERGTNKADV